MKRANLGQLSRVMKAEAALIGTIEYQAQYSWFHNYEYRHYLRDISRARYLRVYRALIRAGLDPSGKSPKHLRIIQKIAGVK